jgi:hypothetical protein
MLLMLKIKYDLIQHKTYAVEMSTQTDKLEIGFNGTTSNGSELEKYMQVSSSDGEMV